MKWRVLAVLFTVLLAGCPFSGSLKDAESGRSLADGVFRMQYYDIRQPERLLDGGEQQWISFGYAYSVQGIEGKDLGVLWQGKIRQPETGMLTIQHSDADKLQIEIDGQTVPLKGDYTDVRLEKGSHDVLVRYEPKWHADEVVVNFWRNRPRAPESLANDLQAAAEDAMVGFAQVRGQVEMDGEPNNWQWRDAELFVPAADRPQILLLSAYELANVKLTVHEDADIEAIVALEGVGEISGSDAPVYRVAKRVDDDWWPKNCRCIGGTHVHCDGKATGSLPEIQALSRTLFGKQPAAYVFKSEWYMADKVDERYRQAMDEYQEKQAKCGGSQAIGFDNAMRAQPNPPADEVSGSLKNFDGQQSWLSAMGGTLPESGFDAYYFKQDQIGQPVAQENVPHIGLNYASNELHQIDAEQFAALWAGYLTVNDDTAMSMQYDLSWAKIRVWLNGQKVFESPRNPKDGSSKNHFDVIVPKGKNRLEVEYINHWHTVGFAFFPQLKLLLPPDEEVQALIRNPQYEVVIADVYESGNRDNSLPVTLPESQKPIVLVLKSHHAVFWQLQPGAARLKAVIIQEGKGVVSGRSGPLFRVQRLPAVQATWRFEQNTSERIEAAQFQYAAKP